MIKKINNAVVYADKIHFFGVISADIVYFIVFLLNKIILT